MIQLEEFKERIGDMLGGSVEEFETQNYDDQSNEGLTIDKLSEIKIIFENAKERSKTGNVKLTDMQELAKNSSINLDDLNEFLKEFMSKGKTEISPEEFDNYSSKVEKILLEMCLGSQEAYSREQSEYIPSNVMEDNGMADSLPKDGEKSSSHFLNSDDYNLDDYITTVKEMLSHVIDNDNYMDMSLVEIGRLVKDLNNYIAVIKKKSDQLSDELSDIKNKLDNKEYQETFLQNKIQNYQETLEECQNAKEKLERELEQSFNMEADFKRLKDRNAELDMEILNSTQEYQRLSSRSIKTDREFKRLKKRTDELEKETMEARSDKAELTVEIERLQDEVIKLKTEMEKKNDIIKKMSEKGEEPKDQNEAKEEVNNEGTKEIEKPIETELNTEAATTPEVKTDQNNAEMKFAGDDPQLKRKFFDLKKKYDSIQAKFDVSICLINLGYHRREYKIITRQ